MDGCTLDFGYVKNYVFKTYIQVKENIHHLYYMSQKETFLTNRDMIKSSVEAVLISIAVFMPSIYIVKNKILDESGVMGDCYSYLSILIFTVTVLNINLLVLTNIRHFSIFIILIILLTSIVPYALFVYIYDRLKLNRDTAYSARLIFSQAKFALEVFILLVISILPQIFQYLMRFFAWPSLAEYALILKDKGLFFKSEYWQKPIL